MKGFIQLKNGGKEFLVNVDSIAQVYSDEGKVKLRISYPSGYQTLNTTESLHTVFDKIKEATDRSIG